MSAISRFGAWLLTESGRKFMTAVAATTAIGVSCAKILPHTYFLDKYEEIVHLYKHGMLVPVPKEIQAKFEMALELAGVSKYERHLYKPFMVIGFDVFSAGSTYSSKGALIGVPINYTYKDVDSIDKSSIKLRAESIPWITDEGKLLLNSMILSENAQLYALAREIETRNTPKCFLDAAFATISVMGYYGVTNWVNRKFNLYTRAKSIRVVIYILAGLFMSGNYFLMKDFTQVLLEQQIDADLKAKSPIFAEGGKEYYEKMLQRNIAFRKLLGKEGEHKYTALGNENYLFRQRHLPLVQRKDFFEQEQKM